MQVRVTSKRSAHTYHAEHKGEEDEEPEKVGGVPLGVRALQRLARLFRALLRKRMVCVGV